MSRTPLGKNTITSIRAALVALLAAAFLLGGAASSSADEWGPWNITDPGDVCVRADFPETGSGWKVHKAVANWNAAQDFVTFRVGYGPACGDVLVHRYAAEDGTCGHTDFARLWDQASIDGAVVRYAGADVYLNDVCSPVPAMRKTVIAHELGHAIGLVHSTGTDSVMSPDYLASVYKGVPGPSDRTAVAVLYRP